MKINTTIVIIFAGVLIAGAILFTSNKSTNSPSLGEGEVKNVVINEPDTANQKQIIEINARGGFDPEKSLAKAGVPTILRFKTKGTFDCSSSIRIPSLNISKILPQTGETDIDIGTPTAGKLQGMCGMGMYPFEINFKN